MPNPNAVIARAIRIDPEQGRSPAAILREQGDIPVEIDGERSVFIRGDDKRAAGFAQVLAGLSEIRRPAYLEIDPATSAITRIQIPLIVRVTRLREGTRGIEFLAAPSHAVHRLDRDNPWFAEFEPLLRGALDKGTVLLLSEDESHGLLDLREFRPGPDDGPLPPWPHREELPWEPQWWRKLLLWPWRWPWWPWNWRGCISPTRAQQVFDAMASTTCNPLTVPPPCIPFLYPDDGCWGRAHEMCRLMIAQGLKPKKVWIQGWLHTPTRNNPDCFVNWGWHVAPTLCVRRPRWWWWFSTQEMVIDPSLFTTPVSQATWKSVQGDAGATLTPSDAEIFYLWGSVTDPTYSQTNSVLAGYRLALYNRAISEGPPPYANCP